MVTTSFKSVRSSVNPQTTIIIDGAGSKNPMEYGDYSEISTAISQETATGVRFIVAPTVTYSPGSISLGTEQELVGFGTPTINSSDIELTDSNLLRGFKLADSTVTMTGPRNTMSRCWLSGDGARFTLNGNKNAVYDCEVFGDGISAGSTDQEEVDFTTCEIAGNSCEVYDVTLNKLRFLITGSRDRIINSEVRGNITSNYDSGSSLDTSNYELEVNGSSAYVSGNVVEGEIDGSEVGASLLPDPPANYNHIV